jgi:hypothetical protein
MRMYMRIVMMMDMGMEMRINMMRVRIDKKMVWG